MYSDEDNIRLYPNPTNNLWHAVFSQTTNVLAQLYDISGRIVFEFKGYDLNEFDIPAKDLLPGIYFLKIASDAQSYNIKLIKD